MYGRYRNNGYKKKGSSSYSRGFKAGMKKANQKKRRYGYGGKRW